MASSAKEILRIFLPHDDTSMTTGNDCIRLALLDGCLHAADDLIGDDLVVDKGRIEVVWPADGGSSSPSPSEFFSDGSDQEFDLLNAESGPNSSRASGVDVGYFTLSRETCYVEARKAIFGATGSGPLEFVGKILSESGNGLLLLSYNEKNHSRVCEGLKDLEDCELTSIDVGGIIENLIKGDEVTETPLTAILAREGVRRCIAVETAERVFKKAKEKKWLRIRGLVAPMLGRALTVAEQIEIVKSVEGVDALQAILSCICVTREVQLICASRLMEDFYEFPPELVRLICKGNIEACGRLLEASPKVVCPVLKETLRQNGDVGVTVELGRSVYSVGLKDSSLVTEVCGESCALFKLVLELTASKVNGIATDVDRSWDLLIAILTYCLPKLSATLISRPDISATIASILSDLLEPLEALHDTRLQPCLAALMHLCCHQLQHWKAVSRSCPLTEEAKHSVPITLTEAGLVDLAILLLRSPHQIAEEESTMAVLKSLFLSLPTACVFALQQKSLPELVENLAGNVVKRHAKAIVEDEDPELLSMLVYALVEGGKLHVIETLMDEAPLAVARLLLRADPSEALIDLVCDAALANPTPELMELIRKQQPSSKIARIVDVCDRRCKGSS